MVHRKHSSADQACLLNVLHTLHQRNRLPPHRFDQGVLSSDQDLVQQRHNMFVEYLVTGDVGKKQATSKQLKDINRRCKTVHEYRSSGFLSSQCLENRWCVIQLYLGARRAMDRIRCSKHVPAWLRTIRLWMSSPRKSPIRRTRFSRSSRDLWSFTVLC